MKMAKSLRVFAFRCKKNECNKETEPRLDFERMIVPHLPDARKLASWLLHNKQNTDDAVQEACLRALQFFDSFDGRDSRKWLLAIVRNTCFDMLQKSRGRALVHPLGEPAPGRATDGPDPLCAVIRNEDTQRLRRGLAALPSEFQQVLELRELKGMSYRQISRLVGIPVGTVMSRLARGRLRLRRLLLKQSEK
jgi:RNA polymerase sigma-70 factor (ECF subfamily)